MTGPAVGEVPFDLDGTPTDISGALQSLLDRADTGSETAIGFPGAVDIDYTPVVPLFRRLFNNVGDPRRPPGGTAHTNKVERAVINWLADLFGLPAGDRWGYVTAGGTEGNLAALHAAHHRLGDAVVYYSTAAHYSIPKVIDILGIDSIRIDADTTGAMVYDHLDAMAGANRRRPAIVVATAGTTMTEALDEPARIQAVLQHHGIWRRHIHVDAALSGIPLALDGVLRFNHTIDSVAVSGHKFFGTPVPCGVVLIRDSARRAGRHIAYTDTLDTTVSGSRCGQAAVLLWYAIASHGHAGHRQRVRAARDLAAYTTAQLNAIGWKAWRHPHAFTVVLRTPPIAVTRKWLLATEGHWSHTICMPGITQAQIDAFIADITYARSPTITVPLQRTARRPRNHRRPLR